jgi:hypothetical protein
MAKLTPRGDKRHPSPTNQEHIHGIRTLRKKRCDDCANLPSHTHNPKATALEDQRWLVGHAGAVLLRRCADKLTSRLSAALARRGMVPGGPRRGAGAVGGGDRSGATAMARIALLEHQGAVFGVAPGDATVRRALHELDERPGHGSPGRARRQAVRARVGPVGRARGRVPSGAPGREGLTGWIDATQNIEKHANFVPWPSSRARHGDVHQV